MNQGHSHPKEYDGHNSDFWTFQASDDATTLPMCKNDLIDCTCAIDIVDLPSELSWQYRIMGKFFCKWQKSGFYLSARWYSLNKIVVAQ